MCPREKAEMAISAYDAVVVHKEVAEMTTWPRGYKNFHAQLS